MIETRIIKEICGSEILYNAQYISKYMGKNIWVDFGPHSSGNAFYAYCEGCTSNYMRGSVEYAELIVEAFIKMSKRI